MNATEKTSMITTIHGKLWITFLNKHFWSEYPDGDALSWNLFNHIGMLGIDRVHLGVFYNESLYSTPPTVEDIYPSQRYCAADWFKLGAIDWKPVPYASYSGDGHRVLSINYNKSRRFYNPVYAEIRNHTDWVFVQDVDEILVPVNFKPLDSWLWCSPNKHSLISLILKRMLMSATRLHLRSHRAMIKAKSASEVGTSLEEACPLGYSHDSDEGKSCRGITTFNLPVFVWMQNSTSSDSSSGSSSSRSSGIEGDGSVGASLAASAAIPTLRSAFHSVYSFALESKASSGGLDAHQWKSVYQTRHSPLLVDNSIHNNNDYLDQSKVFPVCAPRRLHRGVLSLELAHVRSENRMTEKTMQLMIPDHSLVDLVRSFKRCLKSVRNDVPID